MKHSRVAAAIAAAAMIGLAAPVGTASAAPPVQKPQTFPYLYSNVAMVPTVDAQGKPNPLNAVVWDHATVLTRSQTLMLRDSGVLPVIGSAKAPPYSGLAKVAMSELKTDAKTLRKGGCLSLYWSDKEFKGPSGKMIRVGAQMFIPSLCKP